MTSNIDDILERQDPDIPAAEVGQATENARGVSLLRDAQKRRDARTKNLFLDIPTWDGLLCAEYEIIPKEELRVMGERAQRKIRAGEIDASVFDVDLIIRAGVGLYSRDPDTGDRVPIEDEFGLVGFDRIAIVLDKEAQIDSQQKAVRYLMAERGDDDDTWVENVIAISMHAKAISRWMRDPSKRSLDLDELLGE